MQDFSFYFANAAAASPAILPETNVQDCACPPHGEAVYRISLESLKQSTYLVDKGLLFAYNHPNDNYKYQEIAEHIFYRTIVEVPSNQTISIKQLKQIIQTMHTRGYQECGDIFIYQALTTGNDYGIDVICVEFIVQKQFD